MWYGISAGVKSHTTRLQTRNFDSGSEAHRMVLECWIFCGHCIEVCPGFDVFYGLEILGRYVSTIQSLRSCSRLCIPQTWIPRGSRLDMFEDTFGRRASIPRSPTPFLSSSDRAMVECVRIRNQDVASRCRVRTCHDMSSVTTRSDEEENDCLLGGVLILRTTRFFLAWRRRDHEGSHDRTGFQSGP